MRSTSRESYFDRPRTLIVEIASAIVEDLVGLCYTGASLRPTDSQSPAKG